MWASISSKQASERALIDLQHELSCCAGAGAEAAHVSRLVAIINLEKKVEESGEMRYLDCSPLLVPTDHLTMMTRGPLDWCKEQRAKLTRAILF